MKLVEARLVEEHKRLSDLFVTYNTPGTGSPGFSDEIRKRIAALEVSLLEAGRAALSDEVTR